MTPEQLTYWTGFLTCATLFGVGFWMAWLARGRTLSERVAELEKAIAEMAKEKK